MTELFCLYLLMENKNIVLGWWTFLIVVSVFNIAFIGNYYFTHSLNNKQTFVFALAFIFAIVCAIRTISPTKYTEKTCFLKTKIFTPFIIRSLATIAELAYIILCVYVFIHIIKLIQQYSNKKIGHLKPYVYAVIPIIILAEIFSWSGSITEYQPWNISEEVMWLVATLIFIVLSLYILSIIKNIKSPKIKSVYRFFTITIPIATLFAGFLALVDIPMYVNRWKKDKKLEIKPIEIKTIKDFVLDFKEKHKLDYDKKINDLQQCRKVDQSFDEWKQEIPWLTGYFTIGVWSSFALAIWYKNNS